MKGADFPQHSDVRHMVKLIDRCVKDEDAVAYSEIHKVFALLDELCPSV